MLLMSGTAAMAPTAAMAQTVLPGFVIQSQGQGQTGSAAGAATAESATGPDTTIVAERTAGGSKTDTPVLDLSAAISVVTEVEMEKRGVADVQQALGYTSSVAVDLYGSDDRYDSFLIRGFEVNSTGTFRDGLALRFPGWTGVRMEPYGLQRVEVLKGSTSTLFGLNGPGGMVNGITKRPILGEDEYGEVYTTFGEDHIEAGTDFGGKINDDWSYRITTKGQDGTHGRDFSEDDRIYVAPALTWHPTDFTTLTFLADYQKRDSNAGYASPPGTNVDPERFFGEPDFNKYNTEEKNIGYLFEHKFGSGLTFRQNARYSDIALDYEQVYPVGFDFNSGDVARQAFSVYSESQRFAIDSQLQYDARFDNVETKTLIGVDYLYYKTHEDVGFDGAFTPINYYNPGFKGMDGKLPLPAYLHWKPEQSSTGIYVQEELTFDQRWIVTLGGRYDYVESTTEYVDFSTTQVTTDEAFTKKAGLTYKLFDNVSIYGNYSESFQPIQQPGFDPQEGTQYEVGIKYKPRGLNALFTVALFDLTQTNVPDYVAPNIQQPIGEVNVRGIELEGKIAMYENWNLTMAYSYWDAEIVKGSAQLPDETVVRFDGNRPSLVPEHLASIWVDYTIPANETFGALTLGAGVRFIGSSFGDSGNAYEIDAYTLVDAAVNYKINDDWSVAVNATNIFDEEYLSASFGNTVYYGDGRTVKATLKHSW